MIGLFSLSLDVNTIQLIMLIILNTIENESKNSMQINKMAIEEKTQNVKTKFKM